MPLRVELSNSAADADELEAVLFAAGFEVIRVALGELGQRGVASVVDVAQAGAREAVERLLEAKAHPVVRLGDAGQDADLVRPVRHDTLLVALRRALERQLPIGGATHVTITQEVLQTEDPALARAPADEALDDVRGDVAVMPSDALATQLRQACGSLLLEWFALGQHDDAQRLAPDVLFDAKDSVGELLDHGYDLTPLELALPQLDEEEVALGDLDSAPSAAAELRSLEPAQGWLRLSDPLLGRPDLTFGSREGRVAPLGMIRLLWRIVELGLDLELDARTGDERLVLRFLAGGVREIWGQSCERTALALGVVSTCESEAAAREALDAGIEAGAVPRFVVDRQLRLSDEAQLVELALADEAQFTLRPLTGSEWERLAKVPSPLGSSAIALIGRAARSQLGEESLRRLVAGPGLLRLEPDARSRLEQAEVEPELRALILRHDGMPYTTLLREAVPEVGAAGLLCMLAVLGSARFVNLDSVHPP